MADLILSDDIEPDEEEMDPRTERLGRSTIDKFMQNIEEDRIQSIKRSKALKHTALSPCHQDHLDQNWALSSAFYTNAGQKALHTIPRPIDVERFVERLVHHVKGRSADGLQTPSISWFNHAIRCALVRIQHRFTEFKWNAAATSRIKSLSNDLLLKKELSNEQTRENNWIRLVVMRYIVNAYLSNGLTCGTMSWDVTWSRMTSVLLPSALIARCGDVMQSAGYKIDVHMQFRDLSIRQKEGTTGFENLRMRVLVRFQKAYK